MFFSRNNKMKCNHKFNLYLNKSAILRVSSVSYLGFQIDESIKWNEHIDFVDKKLIRCVPLFYRLGKILPCDVLKSLYFSLVYPHLFYGAEVLVSASDKALNKIEILNKRLLKILQFKSLRISSCDIYKPYNVLSFKKLIKFKILLFVHKWYYDRNSLPDAFKNIFQVKSMVFHHNTRTNMDLYVVRCRTAQCQNSFIF